MQRIGLTTQDEIDQMRKELDAILSNDSQPLKKKKNKLSSVLFAILACFLLFVLGSVFVSKAKGDVPNVFGYYFLSVETGSMEPTLNVGTIIIGQKPQDTSSLDVGIIITFKKQNEDIVTHRIVEVVENGYRTKGDNPINTVDTDIVPYDRVIAVIIFHF